MRGLFLEPIDPVIQSELIRRRKILAANLRSSTNADYSHTYYFGKTPWIKITSNALILQEDGSYDDMVRLSNILQSGVTDPNSTMSPAPLAQTKDLFRPDMRMTALPALKNLSVETKGKLGSIKEARFSFTVFHEDDLELYEQLYMVPGVTLCVEWGWSTYSGESIGEDTGLITKDDYAKEIITNIFNEETPGQYDGLLGIVKNFNYTVNPDGSYDCSVEATSPNSILMSLTNDDSDRYPKYEAVMENSDGEAGSSRPIRPSSMLIKILKSGGLNKDSLEGTGIYEYKIYKNADDASGTTATGAEILSNAGLEADGDSLPHWMKVKRDEESYKYYAFM